MQIPTQLSLKIKKLYTEPLADADAMDAAARLVSFFKILVEVDKQSKKTKEGAQGV